MKKEIIFNTQSNRYVYCTKSMYGTKLNAIVSGYIYLVSKRRLFGFIPLPDKLMSESKLEYYDITGAKIPNSLLPEFTPEGRRRVTEMILDIEDVLKDKRKIYYTKRLKTNKTWMF